MKNALMLMALAAFGAFACDGSAEDPQDGIESSVSALTLQQLNTFVARTPHHVHAHTGTSPAGLSPAKIRAVYGLPSSGGTGTIAIIDAYDHPNAESDLAVFSAQFGLPPCTTQNGCFQKVKMSNRVQADSGWALEIALDIEWAHAIAPNAKILLVEARTASGTDLLAAVDYARRRSDVVAVSMSWGGGEFSTETALDGYFTSSYGAVFFAASGDNGTGASWPPCSSRVVGVGGTYAAFNPDGTFASESAWSGSGGGVSAYVAQPSWQSGIAPSANGKRMIPDVAYVGDPSSGFAVYDSVRYSAQSGWFRVGGTSAGSPQWAAIQSLGIAQAGAATNPRLYGDAASAYGSFFRDITAGTNGSCGLLCSAHLSYDAVTGLGSPIATAY